MTSRKHIWAQICWKTFSWSLRDFFLPKSTIRKRGQFLVHSYNLILGKYDPQLSYLWNVINWRSYLVGGIRAWGFSGFWTPLILPCKGEITIIKNVLLTPVRLFLKLHREERGGSCLNWFTSKDLAPFKMCGRILPFLVFQEGPRFQIFMKIGILRLHSGTIEPSTRIFV